MLHRHRRWPTLRSRPWAPAAPTLSSLVGLLGLAVGLSACEPPIIVDEHRRSSAELVGLDSCDAVAARLRDNTRARYRAIARFRARQMVGDTTTRWDVYDEPVPTRVSVGKDGALPPMLVDSEGRLWVARGGALEVLAADVAGATAIDAVALEVSEAGLLLASDVGGVVRVLVVSATGSGEPVGDLGEDPGVVPVRQTVSAWWATLSDSGAGPALALEPVVEVSGALRGLAVDDDGRAWLGVWFAPTLAISAYPSPMLPLGGVTAALQDTLAEIDVELDALGDAAFLPRLVVDGDASSACADAFVADDGTGRGLLTLVRADADDGTSVRQVVTTLGAQLAVAGDTLVVAEHSDPAWWYWGAESFPITTNLHVLDTSTGAFTTSHRLDGGLVPGGLTRVGDHLMVTTASDRLSVAAGEASVTYDDSAWEEEVIALVTHPAGAWPRQGWTSVVDDDGALATIALGAAGSRVLGAEGFAYVEVTGEDGGRLLAPDGDSVAVHGVALPSMIPSFAGDVGSLDVVVGGPRKWDSALRIEATGFRMDREHAGTVSLAPDNGGFLLGDVWNHAAHALADGQWVLPSSWVDSNNIAHVQVSVLASMAGELIHHGDGAVGSGPLDWANAPRVRGIARFDDGWAVLERNTLVVLNGDSLEERWRVSTLPVTDD
jgi:hypothetical protein